ncbi:MAG TPA: bifunctional hydroxymethylpyrimidine kinase/phosphomethylpyrimidine kinase, partial [Nitrospiria bacterium]
DKMKQKLFPLAAVVTPNIPEAEKLAGMEIDSIQKAEDAARRIHDLGPRNVLITGGHLDSDRGTDLLYDGSAIRTFSGEWIETKNTHGTGCTYSAAITAGLAKGWDLEKSIKEAKRYMTGGLRNSLSIGGGHGPMDHFYFLGEN